MKDKFIPILSVCTALFAILYAAMFIRLHRISAL